MLIWNVTASSASYTPTTSPSSLSLSLSSSFLSDKDTVVTTLGIEGEEEGEEGEEDVSAIFSHRRMEGEHGI